MISLDRFWWWSHRATILASLFLAGDGWQAPTDEESGAARLLQMKALAKTFTVAAAGAVGRPRLGPSAEPVFRYNEAARGFLDGTIWTFGDRGRPLAMLKAEIHENGVVYGLVSLAPETISASGINGWRWSSTRIGLKREPIPRRRPRRRQGASVWFR